MLKCLDMKENGQPVAIKLSKNGNKEVQNAQTELQILEYLNQKDTDNYNILKFYESFTFRGHFLIVTEILQMNLIEYIDQPLFLGMPRDMINQVARQLLIALKYLRDNRIIHCDIKPENILFTDNSKSKVKIIDSGIS